MPSKSSSRTLIDHDEIQRWAEERGAKPAAVRNTSGEEGIGIIRLDFPGYSGGDSLEEIEWEEWFEKFDDNNLALVVQEKMANGQKSNFNKLVNRENVEVSSEEESDERSSTTERSGRPKSAKRASSSSKKASPREGGEREPKRGISGHGGRSTKSSGKKKAA
jgi:hypothetical protein